MGTDKSLIRKLESADLLHKTMSDYYAGLKSAQEAGKKIAWCSSVGPAELLYSMDFEVYFPENHAAIIGSLKIADKYIPIAVANGYSPEICSYLTSDIGAFLKNETPLSKYGFNSPPRPDVLVYNTNQCQEIKEWFSYYARHYNVPVEGIHSPLCIDEVTPDVVEYVSRQFQNLITKLQNISDRKFDLDKYRETIKLSRDACALWRKVLETAKKRPSPINFFDASIHMGPIVVMRGTKAALNYYEVLLAELNRRVQDKIGAVPNERYRIYWDGMPLWFKLSSLAKLFAKLNLCVVASTYCNSWIFDDLDPKDPLNSSALAYTKLFIARSNKIKEQILEKLLYDYAIDGIIYHDSKTCSRNSNSRFGLQTRLYQKTQIPFLEIQGDLNDSRCYSEEQGVTAIETFASQLEMRK